MVGWQSQRDEICLHCPCAGPYQRKGSVSLPIEDLLPKTKVQTWGQLDGKVTTAENSDSVQPMKPQPLSPQRRSCLSQAVKVASKLNGLLLIWLLMLFPPWPVCVCIFTQAHTHQHILPHYLPKQRPLKYLKIMPRMLLCPSCATVSNAAHRGLRHSGEKLCCTWTSL